MIETD